MASPTMVQLHGTEYWVRISNALCLVIVLPGGRLGLSHLEAVPRKLLLAFPAVIAVKKSRCTVFFGFRGDG